MRGAARRRRLLGYGSVWVAVNASMAAYRGEIVRRRGDGAQARRRRHPRTVTPAHAIANASPTRP